MAFFNSRREKQVQTGKWLMIISILLLCLLQSYTLNEVISNTRDDFENQMTSFLIDKISKLNIRKWASAPFAVVSYNQRFNQLRIIKAVEQVDTTIRLDSDEKLALLTCQANYDIRDTSIWRIDSLGAALKNTFNTQKIELSYFLTLTDENGKILDTYKYHTSVYPIWTISIEIPLGFLEHHTLTAEFIYPLSSLWHQIWIKAITLLVLYLLLIASIYSLFIKFRNEKKTSKFRKMLTDTLVHDLRTPMIYIKQSLEDIETIKQLTEEQKETLEKCKEKLTDTLKGCNRLLSASVTAYGLLPNYEEFDLVAMVHKLTDLYQRNYPNKKISITLNWNSPIQLWADPALIEDALGNLIHNSILYSGPEVCIQINYREEKKKVILTLMDNGFGITPEELKYIFCENYRGKKYAKDRTYKGYGLGLPYVRTIVRAHKGHIFVKSEEKNGSEFTIELPKSKKHE